MISRGESRGVLCVLCVLCALIKRSARAIVGAVLAELIEGVIGHMGHIGHRGGLDALLACFSANWGESAKDDEPENTLENAEPHRTPTVAHHRTLAPVPPSPELESMLARIAADARKLTSDPKLLKAAANLLDDCRDFWREGRPDVAMVNTKELAWRIPKYLLEEPR